jgi:uncharacterized protein YqgC (DUF456 family)
MITPENIINFTILAIMIIGLLGLILPIFPGLVVIWVAGFGYGLISGFETPGWIFFTIITILMIVGSLLDNVIMAQQAHQKGASWLSVLLAMVFGVLGNFIVPVIGGLVGALLALFLAEWIRRKNWQEAMDATRGWAIGCGWAVGLRFLIGLLMIGLWILWVLF